MAKSITQDVGDVFVCKLVDGLLARLASGNQIFVTQHTQVLGDQWLARSGAVDEIVHARWPLIELKQDL